MPAIIRLLLVAILAFPTFATAQYTLNYRASITTDLGSGHIAPYYLSSLKHGKTLASKSTDAELSLWRPMSTDGRFSYGFGLSAMAGAYSKIDYQRYDALSNSWTHNPVRHKPLWIQQLWGDARWRSIFIEAGMKERGSALLNQSLTSGDLIESGNTRPIPQIRAGFYDFQPISFTNGWVEVQGEVAYGLLLDDGWKEAQFNRWTYHIVTDELYNYKRFYFRTKPSMPLSVTVGMQAAAFFGGNLTEYRYGKVTGTKKFPTNLKAFFDVFFPHEDGGEEFYTGNHLGSWDLKARYRLKNDAEVSAYFSWPWDDGSGIGKLNGWDGLWGLEYKSGKKDWINGAVFEYLDFRNQSGPMHYAPADHAGTTITDHASGADDYYNNGSHSSYAYFGRSIGTPALMAPAFNLSGYPAYLANAMQGFHIGVEGSLSPTLTYIAKGGYRKAWGNGKFLLPHPLHLTAVMVELSWNPMALKGLNISGSLELDRGNMPCNAFGTQLSVKYDGLLNF